MKINKVEKLIEKISYEGRQKKMLLLFKKERKKYAVLPEDEFILEYIETAAIYEHKKTMLVIVFITCIVSALTGIWKCIYDMLTALLVSVNIDDSASMQSAQLLSCFIIMLIFIAVVLLVYNLSRNLFTLSKKKMFLEEMKVLRD